jgi:replicative DNA helicase
MIAVSKEAGAQPDEVITRANHFLEDLNGSKGGSRKKLMDCAQVALDNAESAGKGVGGDFFTINLNGFQEYAMVAGNLVIVAARPAMGKTAFAMMLALQWGVKGHPVLINSLEMTGEELAARDMASSAGLSGFRMMTGRGIEDYQYSDMALHANKYKMVEVCSVHHINDVRAEIRSFRRDNRIDPKTPIVFIYDYIQLGKSQGGNREQEVSNISRTLKQLAGEENCLIIALSQLSRAVEARGGDKKPMLSDLRESGSIEQDANMVMFLYRPEYYELKLYEDGTSTEGICEVIFAKTRMGSPGGAKKTRFVNGMFSSFRDNDQYRDITKTVADVRKEKEEEESRSFEFPL